MAWLPDGEINSKLSLFVLAQLTNVTDGRTPGDSIYRYASRGKNACMDLDKMLRVDRCRDGRAD